MRQARGTLALCGCNRRCGDLPAGWDRKGVICKALPGSWALQHEHRPVPASAPFDATCRICGYYVEQHARRVDCENPLHP